MKRISLLIFTITLFSCAYAEKKQNITDETKISYGIFNIQIPTEMLSKATITVSDGPLIIFEDGRNFSVNVLHYDDEFGECGQKKQESKGIKRIKEELGEHKMKHAYIKALNDSSCVIDNTLADIYVDSNSEKILYTTCRKLKCETFVVNNEMKDSEQILMFISKGFDWEWILRTLKGGEDV